MTYPVLYKYAPLENWASFFKDWTIRFTPPSKLNDPYECMPVITCDNSTLDKDTCNKIKKSDEYRETVKYKYDQYCEKIGTPFISYSDFLVFTQNNFDNMIKKLNSNPLKMEAFANETVRFIRDKSGILCMTESPDNMLMWSHYANSHNGDRKSVV